jgi:hypothetical protein
MIASARVTISSRESSGVRGRGTRRL